MKRWKRPLGWFSKFVLVLNGIVILGLLLSYLAPYVDPKLFWPFAFIGIAYPILLLITVLFIAYWLFRKPKVALLSVLSLLIGWNSLTKTVQFGSNVEEEQNSSFLRIMSYNVHLFKGYGTSSKVHTTQDILKIFKEVDPDIICIQKFYTRKKGEKDVRRSLIKALGYKHYYFEEVAENDFDAYGIAIFSKYPIVETGNLPINIALKNVNRIQYADIKKDDKVVRVYNVHLQSIGFKKEDYAFINNRLSNVDEDLSSTRRIGGRLKNAFIKRSEQVNLLYDHIQQCEIPYVVAGDFNDTPTSYSVNKIARDMNNAFAEKGSGWGVTYNGDFPNFQIDYILASKEFKVKTFGIRPERISDHYPIWSDLEL
ncbi:MAG TPA: endonuclease/exonuclease/phosphatase family protein [Sphingobacteriaceae bacterium]|nr:endonuclease/exonuclease/phosphatase family protein [Sphingobacteriaceae bacterium]